MSSNLTVSANNFFDDKNMYFLIITFYWWICCLFGFWYFERSFKPSEARYGSDRESAWAAVIFASTLAMWFYWPLAFVYLYQEKKENDEAEIEAIKKKAGAK